MKKYIYLHINSYCILLLILLFKCHLGFSQRTTIRIEGTVTDLDGNPVNSTIRHSAGSQLVINGEFSFDLKRVPDTVRFTAVGFATVVRVINSSTFLRIRMTPETQDLEEVIVNTGYQSLSPHEFTGSIALIDEKSIQMKVGGNILDRIVGHSSGLMQLVGKTEQSGSQANGLLVRGLGTINGPIEPLIILDGFIYDGDINNINPNDVASVSILKDASAASIWGARAGNGVIVIVTKSGRFNQSMQVSFQTDQSLQRPAQLNTQYGISAMEEIEIERFLFEQGYFETRFRTPYNPLTPIQEILLQHRQGKLSEAEVEQRIAFWAGQNARQNYLDEFYTNSYNQNYNLQINGGSDRNAYLIGGSYSHKLSETYNQNSRLNVRLNNQFKISDRISLATNVQLSKIENVYGRPSYGTYRPGGREASYLAFRDENGNPIPLDLHYRGSYTDSIGAGKLLDWKHYPADNYRHIDSRNDQLELFSVINLAYSPIRSLKLNGSFQYQIQNSDQVDHSNINEYNSRNTINQYTQFDPDKGTLSYVVPLGGIYNSRDASIHSFTWRGQANFREQYDAHTINSIIGIELKGTGTGSQIHATQYGYQEDPLTYVQVDAMTRYPHFITGSPVRIGGSTGLSRTDYRFVSLYGNLAYSYLNRYTFTGSVRRDGSNVFGANVNDRWTPLWSAGIGWDISNEPFFEGNLISKLKAVVTYGVSGNVDMTKTASPIGSYSTNPLTGYRFARITNINNPDLRWEKLSQFSMRIDLQDKSRRITSSFNFFKKYGRDLYGQAPYDFTGWGASSTIVRNVASMEGYGVEMDLKSINYRNSNFEWSSFLFSNWNENVTTEYYKETDYSDLLVLMTNGNRINPVIGKPLYSISAYKWGGLDENGNPMGFVDGVSSTDYMAINEFARVDGDNIRYIGATTPRFFGTVANHIRYRSISLSIGIGFHLGYFVKKGNLSSSAIVNGGAIHVDYLKRWQNKGDERITDIPSFVYPVDSNRDYFYGSSEVHVIPADHLKMDYLRINYALNTTQWSMPFKQFDVNFGLENGPLLWKKNELGLDPNHVEGNNSQILWSGGIKVHF